jgi:hypothetical protein
MIGAHNSQPRELPRLLKWRGTPQSEDGLATTILGTLCGTLRTLSVSTRRALHKFVCAEHELVMKPAEMTPTYGFALLPAPLSKKPKSSRVAAKSLKNGAPE